MGAYPKPDEENWQEKYRYAFAKDEVYTNLFSAIQSWTKEKDQVIKKEAEDKDIIY